MRARSRTYAERGLQIIAQALEQRPPLGVSPDFVRQFFGQFRVPLIEQLAALLDSLADQQARLLPSQAESVLDAEALQAAPFDDLPPDEWSAAARSQANVAAIRLLASGAPIGPAERQTLLRYSGSGGLSLDAMASQVPAEWLPELQGQVHEYYTPTRLCREVARVLRTLLSSIRFGQEQDEKPILALEPSAGIGRFIHASSGPGFERLRWTAVEYSHVSAKLLSAIRPDIPVFEGPFETWVTENEAEVWGQLGLVISNPPYGKRGGTITLDPDPRYREPLAYPYFVRRTLDLLGPSGIGVFLIPYGFLSSKQPRFVELRRKVLLRHHLMAAFRLPSELFPGASLVTDLLFFRARGGELDGILGSDVPLVEGRYFEAFPHHILGRVIGEQSEDESEAVPSKRPRRGYEIAGTFTVLPPFVERPGCASCWVKPIERPERKATRKPKKEDLPPHLLAAVTLGDRVAYYLKHFGASDPESAKKAALLFPELHDALLAWQAGRRAEDLPISPYQDRELQRHAKDFAELVSFLSAFENDGRLARAFAQAPVYVPRYSGALDDVVGQAQFLYGTQRRFTTDDLAALRRDLKANELLRDALNAQLYAAGWCQDVDEWQPDTDYFTGELWPKYRRAKERASQGDAEAERQATRLYQLIDPPPLSEISAEPRMPWVPLDVLRLWLEEFTGGPVPALVRDGALLRLAGKSYHDVSKAPYWLRTAIPLPGEPSRAARKVAVWLKKLRRGESLTAHRRGSGRVHKGRDLFAPVGTPVLALKRGRVLRVVRGSDSERATQRRAGVFVDVGGEDGDVWRYLHLLQPVVEEGQLVKLGDRLASVGTSGIKHASAHLHLERRAEDFDPARRDYGEPRDPLLGLNLDDDERSLAMDIDWKNTLDKVLTVGGPAVAKALDTTYPGAGIALAAGVTLLDEQVVKPYVPGKEPAKPAAAPAPAVQAAPAPQPAPSTAAPSATFASQAAEFLKSTGWSPEEVGQLLLGPKKGEIAVAPDTAPKSAGTVHHFITLRKQPSAARRSRALDEEDELEEAVDESLPDEQLALADRSTPAKALEHHFVTLKRNPKTTG